MNIKMISLLCGTLFAFGCSTEAEQTNTLVTQPQTSSYVGIYPKPPLGYVGDPMPFWESGTMNMFYLYDGRDGQVGFHPYNLMTTTDLTTWQFEGTVIPFVNDNASPDLALGTGSIIRDSDGLYHAYYTGWNGRSSQLPYHEIIQHATSTDKINWTKHPEHGFYGGHNDFRDPYVLFMAELNEYWMIVTTRDLETNKPILAKYTSEDLISWGNKTTLYTADDIDWNMECPTLIKIGDYWYLSFSRQGNGNERTLYYVYTDNLGHSNATTEWVKPTQHLFDGPGQYAARIEKFADKHIVSGWVGTKQFNNDSGNYDWAGNLVTHEVYQSESGELFSKAPAEYKALVNKPASLESLKVSSGVSYISGELYFNGNGYETITFSPVSEATSRLTLSVNPRYNTDHFGFIFSLDNNNPAQGNTKLELNHVTNKINLFINNLNVPRILGSVDFAFPDGEYQVSLYSENDIMTLYVDDKIAFTARLPSSAGQAWGIFSYNSDIVLKDVALYSH